MAARFGQTITVVNQSGKVVSTSKQLLSVFKEAKAAYRERKAEIVAERRAKAGLSSKSHKQIKALERGMDAHTISEVSEPAVRPSRSRGPNPPLLRRHSSSSSLHTHSEFTEPSTIYPSSHHRYAGDLDHPRRHSSHHSRHHRESIHRSRTAPEQDLAILADRPKGISRSKTNPVDMDLAYGDFHAGDLQKSRSRSPEQNKEELSSLVLKARMLLDEANCAHHSVTAIINHLQKNPDAMAAVALTLAEISNVASKMAPGALTAIKTSAPAVFALLASPQFLIAAGVGVGITVVALGGYKIIKRIQNNKKEEEGEGVEREGSMDEMMEIGGDISRIESWRRGIADVEMDSLGTTVDGEFITPEAARMSGFITPMPDRVSDLKTSRSGKSRSKSGKSRAKSDHSDSTSSGRRTKSDKKERKKGKDGKEKKPSPLRLMFR